VKLQIRVRHAQDGSQIQLHLDSGNLEVTRIKITIQIFTAVTSSVTELHIKFPASLADYSLSPGIYTMLLYLRNYNKYSVRNVIKPRDKCSIASRDKKIIF
jgi:hypothetical protein